MEKAVFGAGCFWGVEAFFEKVRGVEATRVGYSGGTLANPTYEQVKAGDTSHAEVVEVLFDPWKVSYDELLDVFFDCHDPTTKNRQGIDIGSQYRSVIFFQNVKQLEAAKAKKEKLDQSGKLKNSIVTEITPAKEFYEAEEYHQKYFQKNGTLSCGIS
ncbi:peptide-methionine (S)-S-oxide reductase MsrA [Bacillus solimangrovi]|uniref:Peptide methionine sulfoxide reductase MsrA n=1 Tax=Bacillus solimangrovi TaxID=1305675 RepID=A0A1E5LGA8_9BACI|nr:peptide-methionine (S)-S-oxide reductase MsrA [Bacillus solimangrovi]OEH93111.1 peptide-methionine (S)-S-oxide reductase [Bacillus solimangrovi]